MLGVLSLSLCLAVTGSSVLRAQVIRGVVIDSIATSPVSGVQVELLSPQAVVGKAVSDDSGHFRIGIPASGPYRFRARRLGYHDLLSISIPIEGNRDATITLRLSSLPVALQALNISATSQIYLQNIGFYERQKSDPGLFMSPDETLAAASKAQQTADVLDGISGVTMLTAGGSRGVRVPTFSGRSGIGCDNGPRIYLDNHLLNPGNDQFDVNTIHPSDLLAIEIYRHTSEVPLKFGGPDADCGAIVFWTKH